MKRHTIALAKLALLTALTGMINLGAPETTFASSATSKMCVEIFSAGNAVLNPKAVVRAKDPNDLIYPLGVDAKSDPEGFIQISYESEYLFTESGKILMDYAPKPELYNRAEWNKLSQEQRIAWVQSQFTDKPENATESGLVKVVDIDFLPETLVVDSTGNLEIIMDPPFNSYRDWSEKVDFIVARYGAGSQQAMMSKPRASAFKANLSKTENVEQHLGWINFSNLYDTFQKLKSGALRFLRDQTKLTALSFDHPYVGPMTKARRDTFEAYMWANADGKFYDKDHKQFVRKSDASFKYTGGPSYRPDIAGPNRWSWEIRNAHKDVEDLKEKVQRDIKTHTNPMDAYVGFAKVPAFDTVENFAKLPEYVQAELQKLFPSKADHPEELNETENLVLQVYRNFSMPMMDFSALIKELAVDAAAANQLRLQVNSARVNYLQKLETIASQHRSGKISSATAKAQIMGALGVWALESDLIVAFEVKAIEIQQNQNLPEQVQPKQVLPEPALPKGA